MHFPTPAHDWIAYGMFVAQAPIWALAVRNIVRLRRIRGDRQPRADNHSRAAARTSAQHAARAAYAEARAIDAKRVPGTRKPGAGASARLAHPEFDGARAPDYIGPLVGFRAWRVLPTGQLCAVAQRCEWPIGAPIVAQCMVGGQHAIVPAQTCSCGVYAAKDLTTVPLPSSEIMAWGEVSLWGRVVVHGEGWRAQYAYPKRMVVLFGPGTTYSKEERQIIMEHIRANYGIEAREGGASELMDFVTKKGRRS